MSHRPALKPVLTSLPPSSQRSSTDHWSCVKYPHASNRGSRGLTDRALDLKPEVTQGCGLQIVEVRPLSKAPNPQLLPGRRNVGCPLLQVCTLGWVKCREHISLLIILCIIIVYVTNKAHLSLICIVNAKM